MPALPGAATARPAFFLERRPLRARHENCCCCGGAAAAAMAGAAGLRRRRRDWVMGRAVTYL